MSTSDRPGTFAQIAGAVRLLHPFPSILDAIITVGLVRLAGGSGITAGLLGLAMLAMQASIGSLNDLLDVERDRDNKPGKPLPRGLVTVPIARLIVLAGFALGLSLSIVVRPVAAAIAVAGLAAGYAYDVRFKASPWSWLPFALGIPLLPLYAWVGATGRIPSAFLILVPMAILGGAALALANGLADDERDRAAGVMTTVGATGRPLAWRLGAGLQTVIAVIAISSLIAAGAPFLAFAGAVGAISLTAVGLTLGRRPSPGTRERAWEMQAIGLGCLAVAWLAGLVGAGRL